MCTAAEFRDGAAQGNPQVLAWLRRQCEAAHGGIGASPLPWIDVRSTARRCPFCVQFVRSGRRRSVRYRSRRSARAIKRNILNASRRLPLCSIQIWMRAYRDMITDSETACCMQGLCFHQVRIQRGHATDRYWRRVPCVLSVPHIAPRSRPLALDAVAPFLLQDRRGH